LHGATSGHARRQFCQARICVDRSRGVTGAIVGFLGLGYLVYYFIARRKTGDPGSIPMPA
jgi:hypothetical protein